MAALITSNTMNGAVPAHGSTLRALIHSIPNLMSISDVHQLARGIRLQPPQACHGLVHRLRIMAPETSTTLPWRA